MVDARPTAMVGPYRYESKLIALGPAALDNATLRYIVDAARAGHYNSWEEAMTAAAIRLACENNHMRKLLTDQAMLRPPAPLVMCAECPHVQQFAQFKNTEAK